MESIVFFVIIAAINLISKSLVDKKKIEKARVERAKQLRNEPKPFQSENVSKAKPSLKNQKVFRDETIAQYDFSPEKKEARQRDLPKDSPIADDYLQMIKEEDERMRQLQEETQREIKKGLERKKLVNAIIWSEILGEPKSIKNMKKSM